MKTALRFSVSLGIAAGLVAVLMRAGGLSLAELWDTVRRLPLWGFAGAFAVHLLIYALRSWRFCILIPGAPPPTFAQAYVIGAAHNLASYVLPAKTGEGSWVIYLRQIAGVPSAVGLASLLVSRLLDLAFLCLLFAAACVWMARGPRAEYLAWALPTAALVGLAGMVFLVLASRAEWVAHGALRLLRAVGLERSKLGARIHAKLGEAVQALSASGGGRALWKAAALTVLQWLAIFAFYAIPAKALGLPVEIGWFESAFGSSLAVLSNLLPINGLAGFGTQEAGWVLGFGVLGVEHDLALSIGIGVHLVQLFDVLLLGLLAHVLMAFLPRPGLPVGASGRAAE